MAEERKAMGQARVPDLSGCVHCGLCLTACPTFRITGLEAESPRGRVWLLERVRHGVPLDADVWTAIDDCLDCRACEAVCPAHVPVGHAVEAFRATADMMGRTSGAVRRAVRLLLTTERGLKWVNRAARLANTGLGRRLTASAARRARGPVREAARLASAVPQPLLPGLSRDRMPRPAPAGSGPDLWLFVGCVMDSLFGETNLHTQEVLAAAGYRVVVPSGQRCCGALSQHAGDRATAREVAAANLAVWDALGRPGIAVNAAGCGAALKEYPALLDGQETAKAFAARVRDVSEWLADGNRLPVLPRRSETVTVQDACHLAHAQGIRQAPRTILARAGYRILEMPDSDRCCGSAGIYNLTHGPLAELLMRAKVGDIPEGVSIVATGNPGCYLQLVRGINEAGRQVQVRHTVDLVWQALVDAQSLVATGGGVSGR